MVELLQTSSNKWFPNNQHETHETTGAEQIAQSLPSQPSTATTFSNDLPSSEGLVASKGNLPWKSSQLWIKHPRLHGSTAQEIYGPVVHPIWCIKKWLSSSHPHVPYPPYPFRPQRRSVWRHLRSAAQLWGLHAVRLSHGRSCSWRHGHTALSRSSDTSSITRALESWNHSVVKVLMIIWILWIYELYWIIWYDILFLSPHHPNAAYSQSRDTKMNRSKIKRRILMVPNGRGRDYSTINV